LNIVSAVKLDVSGETHGLTLAFARTVTTDSQGQLTHFGGGKAHFDVEPIFRLRAEGLGVWLRSTGGWPYCAWYRESGVGGGRKRDFFL
jgi:hypothetical protein